MQKPKNAQESFELSSKALKSNNIDQAIYWCNQTIKMDSSYSLVYLRLGNIFRSKGDYGKAIELLNNFLKISIEKKNIDNIAKSYNALGQVYFRKNESHEALTNFFLALRHTKPSNINSAKIYNNIAVTYIKNNYYPQALIYYKKALKIYKKLNLYDNISYCYFNIATLFKKDNKISKAMIYIKKHKRFMNKKVKS